MCGSEPMSALRNSPSKPFITELMTIMAVTPTMTPRIEMTVITETNERFARR
jgi:hypothetical protein